MKTDPVITRLLKLIAQPEIGFKLAPLLARVEADLLSHPKLPQAWEPLPLSLFGREMPIEIKSCWFFVLRKGALFGAERHPNSHQRSFALKGSCLFEVFDKKTWAPHPLDAVGKSIKSRTLSIPPGTWHRLTVGPSNFVSLSFHTVPAKKLVEETPVGKDLSVTKKRVYHTR
jgi:hypothetical protein